MVQPIQYQIPGALNPFENLVSGLKLGATMADMDAARAQQQAAVQLAQQKALAEQAAVEQKALAYAEISAYLNKPPDQRTQEDTRKLVRFLPAEQIKNLMAADATLSDKQRENQVVFAGQVGSALKSKNPEVAMNIVRERFDAESDPQKKQGLKLLLDSIEKAPDLALETLRMSTLALGDKYEKAANAMFGAAPTAAMGGKTISSAADKMAAGITDAEGKPLPGTFFVESGKEPKLVKGEAAPESKETFRILPAAEAKSKGLPSGTYQIDDKTGRITAVGSGGVTVNMPPQIGSIPQDYRVVYDKNSRPISMEVIPGTKTARELEVASGKAAKGIESTILSSGIVLEDIGKLKKSITTQKAVDPVTGITGSVASQVPGSARKSAEGLVRTIQANIGFDRLGQMRAESPTGGALGNITEQELKFLQSVLGSIDLDQKDADIVKNLDRLQKIYNNIIKKAAAYPNAAQYGFGVGGSPASTPAPASSPAAGQRNVTVNY